MKRQPLAKRVKGRIDDQEDATRHGQETASNATEVTDGIASIVIKGSNKFFKDRHEAFTNRLKNSFMEQEGAEVNQSEILTVLELGNSSSDKRVAARAVSTAFPGSLFSRRRMVFKNMRKIHSLDTTSCSSIFPPRSEIQLCKDKIKLSSDMIDSWRKELDILYKEREVDIDLLKATMQMYNNEVEKFAKLHEDLDAMYEMEIKVLSDKKSCEVLPQSVKVRLSNEFAFMAKRVNLGMRSPNEQIEFLLSDKNFADLRDDFQTECPTLWDVMRSLFPVDGEGNTKKKEMSFAHALSILISLKDRSLRNDVKLCFSLLLQSFGVGCRLMNFLCKMSLTYSWETLGKYLDAFMEKKLLHICKKASIDVPIILLMDNINVYRGNKKYHRLFATFGPKMWNFTGRGILFPNTKGIEHLFNDSHTASESQRDILNLLAEDLMIYGNDAHLEVWNDWKDKFLLQGLDASLNRFPRSLDLTSANEKGFDECLKNSNLTERMIITRSQ